MKKNLLLVFGALLFLPGFIAAQPVPGSTVYDIPGNYTFVIPAGYTVTITVQAWGGGGGGGSGSGSQGGGGGGGYISRTYTNIGPGSYAIAVGSGGAPEPMEMIQVLISPGHKPPRAVKRAAAAAAMEATPPDRILPPTEPGVRVATAIQTMAAAAAAVLVPMLVMVKTVATPMVALEVPPMAALAAMMGIQAQATMAQTGEHLAAAAAAKGTMELLLAPVPMGK